MQVFNKPDKVFHVNEDDDSEFIVAKLYLKEYSCPFVMILFKIHTGLYRWRGGNYGNIYEWGIPTSKISAIKKFYGTYSMYNSKIEFYIIDNFDDLLKVIGEGYA